MFVNGDLPHLPPTTQNFTLLSTLSKDKLTGPNYMDWLHNLKMTLRYESKDYVLNTLFLKVDNENSNLQEVA